MDIGSGVGNALEVRRLTAELRTHDGLLTPVNDVTLTVRKGEMFGLVGESGCGKSLTALSILRLLPPPAHVRSGEILVNGIDTLRLDARDLREIRGAAVSMIFQEPMTSLNPTMKIGLQVAEVLLLQRKSSRATAEKAAINLLREVGIRDAEERANDYPHQLSGGMRQRVMIAMAMACRPTLLVADEPTTALDVTIQAQVLALLNELRRDSGTAVLLITHNFGVVEDYADAVAVMYAGQIVEQGRTEDLLRSARHPYTRGLLSCVPKLGSRRSGGRPPRLTEIPGVVARADLSQSGCAFAPRCLSRVDRCTMQVPPLTNPQGTHLVRCFVHGGGQDA